MDKSTQEDILISLSKHQSLSVLELSTMLNLTKADIRYHISKLLKKNLVLREKPHTGLPGRPAARFKITSDFYENNLVFLIDGLIAVHENRSDLFSKLESYFVNHIKFDKNQLSLNNLNKIIQILNIFHYKARWETHYQGPSIFFNNCPYRQLIQKYPEFCELDRMVISSCLDQEVIILSTIAKNSNYCHFQLLVKNPTQ
ncbi:MAG TPA: winged helix-turn-helix transcriptional regulator [Anaerolineaceae bacterium]|nr:winged helix-turn-helix transcriptional regulator [Anaerolineaceae bacterium]